MKTEHKIIDAMVARAERRADRRTFLRASGGTAAAVAGTGLLAGCFDDDNDRPRQPPIGEGTPPPAAIGVADVLNFALNLEYLEAQFYSFAAFGTGLPANLLGGTGTQGSVTGGRQVNFTDPLVAQYAREIAQDERAHVAFLRQALGSAAVAQPPINISAAADGPFSAAARAAGLIGAGQTFDPYASDENFLLGAYIFEDVGVTAYKGSASLLMSNDTFLEAAAGILAAEAYHAALVRTVLFGKGISTPAPGLIDATESISNARDSLDGPADLDQGVAIRNGGSNIVPADNNGIVFSRTAPQVLNIVFLTRMAAQQGGFFPRGVNGTITRSAAS